MVHEYLLNRLDLSVSSINNMDWSKFEPTDFEYDFDSDELLPTESLSMRRRSVFTTIFKLIETNRSPTDFS